MEVTPLAGVWIEIKRSLPVFLLISVTPLAGVWIEIPFFRGSPQRIFRHSPCGSVD